MSFVKYLESINTLMFVYLLGIVRVDATAKKFETKRIHVIALAVFIVAYELILVALYVLQTGHSFIWRDGISGKARYICAFLMVQSYPTFAIFAIINRKTHVLLVKKIDKFEDLMRLKCNFVVERAPTRNKTAVLFAVFFLYELYIFISQTLISRYNNVPLMIFSILYSISDLCFTAQIFYAAFYGYFLINRYESINTHFKAILKVKGGSIRKRLSVIFILYEDLFEIQLLIVEVFGSMLLYAILFHSVAFTVVVYMIINSILSNSEHDQIIRILLLYFLWMLPYFTRIFIITNNYATVGMQVI